ncbi:MAG: GNAT family N-acetyltransferase [Clostridia bacterium]|nr:GNAT family N-acetyltransferase [Clostridia bacterium]
MRFIEIDESLFAQLWQLHSAYKEAIQEDAPTEQDKQRLLAAIKRGDIRFYGCLDDGERLVGCCSISYTFSTFNYQKSGVFEDFYIVPEYRHQGIAKKLVAFAVEKSGVKSLTVGCADCDADMYRALGFTVPLGNMLAFDP